MWHVNKSFLKKTPLELFFITCCPTGEQEEWGCSPRVCEMAAKTVPTQVGQFPPFHQTGRAGQGWCQGQVPY